MKSRSALLITSAQHDLLHPSGLAWKLVESTVVKNDVVQKLKRLVAGARAARIPVIHSPIELDYEAACGGPPLSAFQELAFSVKPLAKGSLGARIIPELAPVAGDILLPPRMGFSSFWAGTINPVLRELGVLDLYIAGLLSHACVESHARDAVENGYRPTVIRDATAAAGDELLQASYTSLGLQAHRLIYTDEALKSWSGTPVS